MFNTWTFKAQWWYSMFVYQLVQFTTYSLLQGCHVHKDPHSTGVNLWKLWTILAGLFDHGTSGKDHRRTSCASSRKMSSFYLGVYSGSCCRTQIPSSASFLQLTFSITFSYNQPFSLAKGQNGVEGTDARPLLLSSSCLSVCCSTLEFWPGAAGHWGPRRPLY